MNKPKSLSGFTLLEVLVAGLILFMVVATASSVFYASVKSKASAEQYTLSTTFAPMLAEHIRLLILDGNTSGQGNLLDTSYRWASKQKEAKPVLSYENISQEGNTVSLEGRAILWSVTLVIEYQQRPHEYQFSVTSWERQ